MCYRYISLCACACAYACACVCVACTHYMKKTVYDRLFMHVIYGIWHEISSTVRHSINIDLKGICKQEGS
jgi:hypothetical protein